MKAITVAISLLAMNLAFAADEGRKAAIEGLALKMKSAWNKKDLSAFITLFHSGSKTRKIWDDPEKRVELQKDFKQMRTRLGAMGAHEIGLWIPKKRQTVLRIKYSESGLIPGTIEIVKTGEEWKIVDWIFDGQWEPELREK